MTVQWIQETTPVRYSPPQQRQLAGPKPGVLGAAVELATSGIVPALVVLGVVGLAFYGFGKLMQRGGLEENPTCACENPRSLRRGPIAQAPRRRRPRRGRRYAFGRRRHPVRRRVRRRRRGQR